MTQATAPQPPLANPFALQKKQAQPKNVLELLTNDAFKAEVAKVLPKHMNAERMLRVALTTVKMSEKLQGVSLQSFASAMLKCSQYGLEPDGRHAHLIPFKNKTGGYDLNLIFDYKGLVSLVRRSGEVAVIMADVVYEDDDFVCIKGNDARLSHIPNLKSKDRRQDRIYAVYSFVKLKDGSIDFDVMTVDEVNEIRDNSQGYRAAKKYGGESPWDSHWEEMAKKTVFRRHTKWLPLSPETKDAIHADDEEGRFTKAKKIDATVVAPDFTMPQEPTATTPVEEPQPGEETPETGPVEVPNPELGADKPKGRKKPEAPAKPALESKEAYIVAIRDLCERDAVDEKDVVKVLVNLGIIEPGTGLEFAPTILLRDLTAEARWSQIIKDIAEL